MNFLVAQGVANSGSTVTVGNGATGSVFSRNLAIGEQVVVAICVDASDYRAVTVDDVGSGNTFVKCHPDSQFTGVINSSGVLTASGTIIGALTAGQILSYTGATTTIRINSQLTGTTGGAGTYQTSATAAVASASMRGEMYDFHVESYRKYELWRSTITVAGPCTPRATVDTPVEMLAIFAVDADQIDTITPFTTGEYANSSAQPVLSDGSGNGCGTGTIPASGAALASQPAWLIAFHADLYFGTAPTISGYDNDLGAFWDDLNTTTPTPSLRVGAKRLTATTAASAACHTTAAFRNVISFGLVLKEGAPGVPGNASGSGVTVNATAPTGSAQSLTSFSVILKNNAGTPLNTVSRRFWTRSSIAGAAIDGGANGLNLTCNSSGLFTSGQVLSIPGGPGWLTHKDAADDMTCHTVPYNFG